MSQELLQEFCWTCADKPSAIERRNQHLLALEAPSEREDERVGAAAALYTRVAAAPAAACPVVASPARISWC